MLCKKIGNGNNKKKGIKNSSKMIEKASISIFEQVGIVDMDTYRTSLTTVTNSRFLVISRRAFEKWIEEQRARGHEVTIFDFFNLYLLCKYTLNCEI